MTTPITAQNPAQSMPGTQLTPFPPSFGLESQYGGQMWPGSQQQQHPQQQQMSQLLTVAYQVILPQVIATAAQQIQQYVQYLVSSQAAGQGQFSQGQFGQQHRPWGF